jgi:malate dehydrogenase (oxaloacetate-decarboxylating)(NADP+)
VATRPIADLDAYRTQLTRFVYQTGMVMRRCWPPRARPPGAQARGLRRGRGRARAARRAGGGRRRLARPILIGRPAVIEQRIEKAGLRIRLGVDVDNVNPEDDPRFRQYWETYHRLMARNGVSVRRPRPPCGAPTP